MSKIESALPASFEKRAKFFNNGERKMLRKLRRDAEVVVIPHARVLIYINNVGEVVKIVHQEHYGLNIVAVIGSAIYAGVLLPNVVLLEIGVSRAKPYANTHMRNGFGHAPARSREIRISDQQFLKALTVIEEVLLHIAEEKISKRKWVQNGRDWHIFSAGMMSQKNRLLYRHYLSFGVSESDTKLVASIFRSDILFRRVTLDGLGKAIFYRLCCFKNSHYSGRQLYRFVKARHIRDLFTKYRILPHHIVAIKERIPNRFHVLLENILGDLKVRERVRGLGWVNTLLSRATVDLKMAESVRRLLAEHRGMPVFKKFDVLLPYDTSKRNGTLLFQLFPREKEQARPNLYVVKK
ncbi:MAG: hypothetical protein Q7S34_03995 [bacterium]|nr:hypothetical protein [bacterium]